MPRAKEVKITKDGQEGYCLESSVKAWERNGWTRADDGGNEEKPSEESEADAPKKKTTTRKAQ
jgi:hypothetical protein